MPRSTADRISAIISCLSGIGLSSWLILMQPSPRAETSRLLFPSVCFCMCRPLFIICLVSCLCVPDRNVLPEPSTLILFAADLFHPVDRLAVKAFLNGEVHHSCGWRCTVPVLLLRLEPDHVPRMNVFYWPTPALDPAAARRHDQRLAQRVG